MNWRIVHYVTYVVALEFLQGTVIALGLANSREFFSFENLRIFEKFPLFSRILEKLKVDNLDK